MVEIRASVWERYEIDSIFFFFFAEELDSIWVACVW